MIEELKNDKGSWLQLLKFDSAHSNHVDSCATETATEAQSTSEMKDKDKHVNDWMKGASPSKEMRPNRHIHWMSRNGRLPYGITKRLLKRYYIIYNTNQEE